MVNKKSKKGAESEKKHSPPVKKNNANAEETIPASGKMLQLFGFHWTDIQSRSKFVSLLHRPTDPSSLGVMRLAYGFLMFLDIFQERGLSDADYKFGDDEECRFPLIDSLHPLPLRWMYVVYLIMQIGAVGIMLGLLFRISCFLFLITYWYILLLDVTVWNNHSYLFGLCAFLFLFSDANRYWSLDGKIWPSIRNAQVPLWNYSIFRAQFFLLYFVAGLKKLDPDWVSGYSMQSLSQHWIFVPFTLVLSPEQIDLWIVHTGGLVIDISLGFVLFFDATRPLGFIFGGMFHAMNSQIFSIGIFPYMMLATMVVFCHCDWPRSLLQQLPQCWLLPPMGPPQPSHHCVYPPEPCNQHPSIPPPKQQESTIQHVARNKASTGAGNDKVKGRHQMTAVFLVTYVAIQCFLPYSHFLTPGYNNWTNGLYGYSWDMMVHSWSTQHMRIQFVDRDTNESGFLKPEAYTRGHSRWSSHAGMVKQYAMCLQDRLYQGYGIRNVSLYFDVWRSLNDRFQQRMFDPRVDLVTAEWSVFKVTPWQMPLLSELSDWRGKLDEIEKSLYDTSTDVEVTFMADFPGLTVENYIQEDLGNTSLHILKGSVMLQLVASGHNITVREGDMVQVPAGEFHNVHTISDSPACFMYIFVNTTEQQLSQKLQKYEQKVQDGTADNITEDPSVVESFQQVAQKRSQLAGTANSTTLQRMHKFAISKLKMFMKSASMTRVALLSIITGVDFETVFNSTIGSQEDSHYSAFGEDSMGI